MKTLVSFLVIAMLTLTNGLIAQNKTITATVVNVTSDSGKVNFALYNKTNFMKFPLKSKTSKIINGKSTIVFENLEEGEYAIVCYHDKNDNDKMDFSAARMPLEDYGSSNNVMAFAPPSYENAKFMLADKNLSLNIKF
ncbi:DUF2141 domain-containing protein [uncultured Polaribacter sp.]|uniref:DUF2141 domain-containing protein n=1 Tax=uncultured Polaribacter sp. TaxID=174711 RepID=UPI0026192770|nr:DUF2141 domain-containing protein [uncultured Polaribacter sp.]